ncbi:MULTISPECIES: type VI secretion system Vgr family protein [unclassified Pseudomonas]|uniref:type VI secretion system Vgr family protein n=1 Tax=unclassified Pseudomonas TaxID=196821 RepID=UPI0009172D20|nr:MULTISPECIES: type VI secretion system tip protein TssI/VgrG [unclassified Pseudomonas]SFX08307.1 type VI secretion system secreted protein VgrG [Pseudomonas sp. NFACC47-1]SFX13783.1 type VI secretion system secreted protein VgrG [Pseudomonas sp. NFACC43]SFX15047.1 type VI secretion system secreted protein VgrG [Pseudomonas sp. NFACC36]
MRNDTESPFSLTLTQSDLRLQVLRFSGREALNRPYRFDLELIGLAPPISPDTLLGQPAFLRLDGSSGVHGIVHDVGLSAPAAHRIGYRLTLVPCLQNLEQGPQRRVFHRLSVVQILQRLLEDHALPAHGYRFELPHGQYPCRPFCIQYEESDLALLQRLCEEEGIHYHFEHTPYGHVAVFAEDPKSFPTRSVELSLRADAGGQQTIEHLYQHHRSTPSAPTYRFSDRATPHAATDAANHAFDAVDREALRGNPALAHAHQAGRRSLERLRCRQREIHGHSAQPALRSGHVVQIDGHPVSTFNDQWLITEIEHRGRQSSILEANPSAAPSVRDYRNRFSAIPWSTVYRPALDHPRPCIPGYHIAYVLGPSGQPAPFDEHGQVRVSLWNPQQEGIALPVSRQILNGHSVLIAGSEVLVSFLDGDPDRPVLCPGAMDNGGRVVAPSLPSSDNRDSRLLFDWLLNPPDTTP